LTTAALSLRTERAKPETLLETVGDHVRARRAILGLSQAAAAAEIGVCRDALARWETLPRVPDVETMPAVIAFLGYNPLPLPQSFAELLLRTRRTLGLHQATLAEQLGVPFNTLHAWERGLFGPSPERRTLVERRIEELG
jgi:transcriptional regulator with XRE-family HTH domain